MRMTWTRPLGRRLSRSAMAGGVNHSPVRCPRTHHVVFAAIIAEGRLAVIGEDSFYAARSGASVRSILDAVWDHACGGEIDPDRLSAMDADLAEIAAVVDSDRYGANHEYRVLHLVGAAAMCCARVADVAGVVEMARISIAAAAFARAGGDLAEAELLGRLLDSLRASPHLEADLAQALRREFLT